MKSSRYSDGAWRLHVVLVVYGIVFVLTPVVLISEEHRWRAPGCRP